MDPDNRNNTPNPHAKAARTEHFAQLCAPDEAGFQ